MYYNEKNDIRDSFSVVKATMSQNPGELDIVEIDATSMDISGKTAFILCGNNTRDARRGAFYAYCFNGWIDDDKIKKDTTIYSIYYPKDQPLLTNFETNPSFDYNALAEAIFGQTITKDGKTLSTDEIIKNISDIVFFGHSIGGFVMNELMFGLGKLLRDRNFSDEDINRIYENIVFIAYSPYSLVAAPINHLYVTPLYDSMGSTKLVYDRMIKVGNMTSSNPKLDLQNICKFRSSSYYNFLKLFEIAMNGEDIVYFSDHNSLIATPNLLFEDGTKEDHNFAGIINYPAKHPYKTRAGELTTEFLKSAVTYTLSTDREKFSTTELYQKVSSGDPPADEKTQQETEN